MRGNNANILPSEPWKLNWSKGKVAHGGCVNQRGNRGYLYITRSKSGIYIQLFVEGS